MASTVGRISTIAKAKVHAALDSLEDPKELVALSAAQQVEMLTKTRDTVAMVVAARSRLQLRLARLHQESATLDAQARQAVALGREDLARHALMRKSHLTPQIQSLYNQIETLDTQQQALQAGLQRLTLRIEVLRVRVETVEAQHAAAKATIAVGEAASGISKRMANAHAALRRAEDRAQQMQARAAALSELAAAGMLPDPMGADGLTAELNQLSAAAAIEAELASMKRQLGRGAPPPPQLGPGR
jgi:phage shock protein A